MDPKIIFIVIVVLVWGFIYAEIQEGKKKNVSKDENKLEVVGGMNDAVKVATKGDLSVYYFEPIRFKSVHKVFKAFFCNKSILNFIFGFPFSLAVFMIG